MLPDIALEALRYFDRTALEGLQMHSLYLRNLVDRHAGSLPLRRIDDVSVNGSVYIQLDVDEDDGSTVVAPGEEGPETLLHRVNNAFVYRLSLNFQPDNLRFLRYLRDNAHELQCHVRTLHINGASEAIDYDLVDFLGAHFKPQVYEASMFYKTHEDHAILFTRNAFRGIVKHVELELYNLPVPFSIMPQMFGDGVLQTCALTTTAHPCPWIDRFVETFEMAEPGAQMVRSVTALHERFGDVPLRATRHALRRLGHPRRTDAPTPDSDYIYNYIRHRTK